jgi:hypothetical protein
MLSVERGVVRQNTLLLEMTIINKRRINKFIANAK